MCLVWEIWNRMYIIILQYFSDRSSHSGIQDITRTHSYLPWHLSPWCHGDERIFMEEKKFLSPPCMSIDELLNRLNVKNKPTNKQTSKVDIHMHTDRNLLMRGREKGRVRRETNVIQSDWWLKRKKNVWTGCFFFFFEVARNERGQYKHRHLKSSRLICWDRSCPQVTSVRTELQT